MDTDYEDNRTQRGIVPTKIPRKSLYTIVIKFKQSELPRWKPKMTGDYGRKSRDEDLEQGMKEFNLNAKTNIQVSDDILRNAISDILQAIDYDIWKMYFCEPEYCDDDEQAADVQTLVEILRKSLLK